MCVVFFDVLLVFWDRGSLRSPGLPPASTFQVLGPQALHGIFSELSTQHAGGMSESSSSSSHSCVGHHHLLRLMASQYVTQMLL